jgi:hypothetical protein
MAAIKYTESFKKKAALSGYMLKGFYYQYGFGDIYATEDEAISELTTASVIYTAVSAPTPDGYCLTIDYPKVEEQRSDYHSIRIWCKDLMLPDTGIELEKYQLVGAIEFENNAENPFKEGVNNMVFLHMSTNCSIELDNDEDVSHVIGSDMDKAKYANATDKGTFLELPCARRLLLDDRVSRYKKDDVFQIATSGLIKI